MRKHLLVFIVLNLFRSQLLCQTEIGFKMPDDKDKIDIPIEVINNLVVIPITVNRFLPLKFILDTGVETAILTEPEFTPLLQVDFIRKITISGAGVNDSISAFVGQGLVYELPGGIIGRNMNILVLDDNYLKLSERMGRDVHGIIGYDLFKAFVVEINYVDNILTLHRPSKYRVRKSHVSLDMDIINARPYVYTKLYQKEIVDDSVKLMIDSGASHAILLDATQTLIKIPSKTLKTNLGTGLGGEISGLLGRIDNMRVGKLEFKGIIVSIPELGAYSQAIKRGSRQGTLGGEILSRVNPTIDYRNQKLYLRKSQFYKRGFEYDMSGLGLIAKGTFLDTLVVDYIQKGSPAEEVDIRRGDIILTLNTHNLQSLRLNEILGMLKSRPKKKIKVKILRDGEKLKKTFKLRRAI